MTPSQPILGAEREAFDAWYDADEFRREYDKYGPVESAWFAWQAGRAALSGPTEGSEPVATKLDKAHLWEQANLQPFSVWHSTLNRFLEAATPAAASQDAKDAARLHWMQFNGANVAWGNDGEVCNVKWSDRDGEYKTGLFHDWRAAIDAAIASMAGQTGEN